MIAKGEDTMLLKELGYKSGDRLLIINADDFGMCNSTNRAIRSLLEDGFITSTSLMFTCPWMREAAAIAKAYPEFDVGIHLTFTSEWENFKWGPITPFDRRISFVDELGHFPKDVVPVGLADPDDIRKECIAQIETAFKLGVDPTHLDNHMISLHGAAGTKRHFMELVIELSAKYGLPLRMPRHAYDFIPYEEQMIRLADEQGVIIPDYLQVLPFTPAQDMDYGTFIQYTADILRGLSEGVTELIFHPSLESEELKAITSTWQHRNMEYHLFRDPLIQSVIREENIILIKWRDLRELQRSR